MVKTIILLGTFSVLLFGSSKGYSLYKEKCAACHIESISKSAFIQNISNMKAPPMVEVANQVKNNIIIKEDDDDIHRQVVILFLKNYIDNPKLDYSMCNPAAIERFGLMPSQKGKLDEEEKQSIAEWIYDRYEGEEFK